MLLDWSSVHQTDVLLKKVRSVVMDNRQMFDKGDNQIDTTLPSPGSVIKTLSVLIFRLHS